MKKSPCNKIVEEKLEKYALIYRLAIDRQYRCVENTHLTFGGVPERPKGADCKSAGSAFGGSNPPPSTI
jgi:hypothetical protein